METVNQVSWQDRAFACFSILAPLLGLLAALIFKRNNTYVMYYARQGLVFAILGLLLFLIGYPFMPSAADLQMMAQTGSLVGISPVLMIIGIIRAIVGLAGLVTAVFAALGTKRELPVIGYLARLITI